MLVGKDWILNIPELPGKEYGDCITGYLRYHPGKNKGLDRHNYNPSADYLITKTKMVYCNMKMQAVITGKRVHGVGYRVFLLQKALERGARRFDAHNVISDGEQQVIVHIEGVPTLIDSFQSGIKDDYPPDARVFNISFGAYDGYVLTISDFIHIIHVEQLTKGTRLLSALITNRTRC